jgi:GNAT superfamily N-acetyltransferase
MSLTFSTEHLSPQLCDAMDKIIKDYYYWALERGLNDGIPPHNFDWEVYYKSEQLGLLYVTTVRDDNGLVGFTLYMVIKAPHHDDVIMADCDSVFTSVHHQGKGIGKKLLQYTESQLKKLGVKWMTNRYRTRANTKPVFEDLGFKVWETVYMKELN